MSPWFNSRSSSLQLVHGSRHVLFPPFGWGISPESLRPLETWHDGNKRFPFSLSHRYTIHAFSFLADHCAHMCANSPGRRQYLWLHKKCHRGAVQKMDAAWSILPTLQESQRAWLQGKVPTRGDGNSLGYLIYLLSKRGWRISSELALTAAENIDKFWEIDLKSMVWGWWCVCVTVGNSPTKVRRVVEVPTVLLSHFYYLLCEVGQSEFIDPSVNTKETVPRYRGARRKDFQRGRPVIWTFLFPCCNILSFCEWFERPRPMTSQDISHLSPLLPNITFFKWFW